MELPPNVAKRDDESQEDDTPLKDEPYEDFKDNE
jgi:hypothetical protein